MYLVGIDISKFKHDCFIATETGEVVKDNFSFANNYRGFSDFLCILNDLDHTQEIRIGLEATGHYGSNLKLFLHDNGYSFMELNPVLSERYRKIDSLRKTKTDKIDAHLISKLLLVLDYKTYTPKSYHISALKSLTRLRNKLIESRTKLKLRLHNLMDLTFPEYFSFFTSPFGPTSMYILSKYPTAERLARANHMNLFEKLSKLARNRFSYAKFIKLIDCAKSTVGHCNDIYELEIISTISTLNHYNSQIETIESKINDIMDIYDFPTASIKGISILSAAAIVSEFGDISLYSNPGKMLAFAGIEPAVYQSGTQQFAGRMVKHGSPHLRYILMNVASFIIHYNPVFYDYYYKKRNEGKPHRVALTHIAKKLIRIIYKLEKENIKFDPKALN